jgi:hypothetical protein
VSSRVVRIVCPRLNCYLAVVQYHYCSQSALVHLCGCDAVILSNNVCWRFYSAYKHYETVLSDLLVWLCEAAATPVSPSDSPFAHKVTRHFQPSSKRSIVELCVSANPFVSFSHVHKQRGYRITCYTNRFARGCNKTPNPSYQQRQHWHQYEGVTLESCPVVATNYFTATKDK